MFGLIAGYLYWRRGLDCAMLAHIVARIVMITGEKMRIAWNDMSRGSERPCDDSVQHSGFRVAKTL